MRVPYSRVIAGAVLAMALCGASKPPAPAPAHATQALRQYVASMLVLAPENYASMRGARTSADVYEIRYGLTAARAKTCYKCAIDDEFAWAAHSENWYLENRWNAAKTMKAAQVSAYVTSQLMPLLHGYALSKTGSKDYPTFVWRSSSKGLWVYVDTFNGGFTTRVGHDLAKPVHVLASPTADDIQALRNAITNFVSMGIGPASENFSTLRGAGKKDMFGTMNYDLAVGFGTMLRNCHISDDSANVLGMDDYSPKWTMGCETVPMVGTAAQIESQLNSAMYAALPAGFTSTTGTLLGIDDYRYDNTSTQVMADIDSFANFTLPKGLVSYDIGILHFLPKPAATATP